MNLEQIRANFGILLNEANKKGAFDLEQANAAVQTLTALDNIIKQPLHQVDTICKSDYNE
jgi:hypothetical protein